MFEKTPHQSGGSRRALPLLVALRHIPAAGPTVAAKETSQAGMEHVSAQQDISLGKQQRLTRKGSLPLCNAPKVMRT